MNKKVFSLALCAMLFALSFSVEAQQSGEMPRIGLLLPWSPASGVSLSFLKAFSEGLYEAGYVEGRNLTIAHRYAEGASELFPKLAAELVRLNVDIIVTTAGPPSRAAKLATKTIPIVFTQVTDPVAEGLGASLARPGGNITGLSQVGPELAGKRLELLKEAFAKISRVAVLRTSGSRSSVAQFQETQIAAKPMGVEVQSLEWRSFDEIDGAFKAAATRRADALIVLQSAFMNTHRTRIVELAAKHRLPTMFAERTHVESGGLMSYAPSFSDLQRRAATFVDKILKGAKPAELPVEQPTKFELVINLKTAKQIGLTIPPSVLARADRVIK
ncbi:MAG TPA: ABC transporter substrate-binding protein [Candidatus Binatia bacterium]|nr:ABC transporter substrate-binding protein [Candidatus Binatia bacterium]